MALPTEARLYAVVPAAGIGQRVGAGLPKQYLTLHGQTLSEHTMGRLLAFARIQKVVVAVAPRDPWWPQLKVSSHRRVVSTVGGDSRAESVLNGIHCLLAEAGANESDYVLVHDMARPCLRLSDLDALLSQVDDQGALLALPVADTVKQSDQQQAVAATLEREQVWRALTPQLFPLGALRDALSAGLEQGWSITDEASAMERAGFRPRLVQGRADNIKVTHPEDLALARFYLGRQEEEGLEWQSV